MICGGLATPDRSGPGRRKDRSLMLNMCSTKMLRHDELGLWHRILAADALEAQQDAPGTGVLGKSTSIPDVA